VLVSYVHTWESNHTTHLIRSAAIAKHSNILKRKQLEASYIFLRAMAGMTASPTTKAFLEEFQLQESQEQPAAPSRDDLCADMEARR
jgi:hypothetical protein